MAQKGRTLTGARARFMMNGKKVGFATNINGGEEIEYQPQEVVGNIRVQENVPVAYRVSFSAGYIRIVGETLKSQNYFPKSGKNSDEHVQNILLQEDLTAVIEDVKTDKPIMMVEELKASSKNFTISARGIVGEDVTFVATVMKDESEI
jgi:hypothetical protein